MKRCTVIGFLILPFKTEEFLDYGKPKSSLFPNFLDVEPELHWSRGEDQCPQTRLRDFTGVDSLASPIFSLLVFFIVHYGEKATGSAWNFLPAKCAWMVKPVPSPVVAKPVDSQDAEALDKDNVEIAETEM